METSVHLIADLVLAEREKSKYQTKACKQLHTVWMVGYIGGGDIPTYEELNEKARKYRIQKTWKNMIGEHEVNTHDELFLTLGYLECYRLHKKKKPTGGCLDLYLAKLDEEPLLLLHPWTSGYYEQYCQPPRDSKLIGTDAESLRLVIVAHDGERDGYDYTRKLKNALGFKRFNLPIIRYQRFKKQKALYADFYDSRDKLGTILPKGIHYIYEVLPAEHREKHMQKLLSCLAFDLVGYRQLPQNFTDKAENL